MYLLCFICNHKLATIVDPAFPISGAMFDSPDPHHKVPRPWSPVVTWLDMYCPMCNKRAVPQPVDDSIELLTDSGIIKVTPEGSSADRENAEKLTKEEAEEIKRLQDEEAKRQEALDNYDDDISLILTPSAQAEVKELSNKVLLAEVQGDSNATAKPGAPDHTGLIPSASTVDKSHPGSSASKVDPDKVHFGKAQAMPSMLKPAVTPKPAITPKPAVTPSKPKTDKK